MIVLKFFYDKMFRIDNIGCVTVIYCTITSNKIPPLNDWKHIPQSFTHDTQTQLLLVDQF